MSAVPAPANVVGDAAAIADMRDAIRALRALRAAHMRAVATIDRAIDLVSVAPAGRLSLADMLSDRRCRCPRRGCGGTVVRERSALTGGVEQITATCAYCDFQQTTPFPPTPSRGH